MVIKGKFQQVIEVELQQLKFATKLKERNSK